MSVFGWRARVGLVLPADNAVAEPELYSLNLPGISFHGVRLSATDHTQMREQAVEAASVFAEMGVDVAVYACAETSFNAGGGNRERLAEVIAQASGVPVTTATSATLEAVAALRLKRLAVVTPYSAASGELFEETLREHSIDVTRAVHRDFREGSGDPREWFATNRQPAHTVYDMVRGVVTKDADGVVISSTNLCTLPLLDQAEADIGKPIVSSNQSIVWWCLRELGIKAPVPGYGELLRMKR